VRGLARQLGYRDAQGIGDGDGYGQDRLLLARLVAADLADIDGRPIHRATWAQIWAPAARKAGIAKGTGLHSLRHYFATLLIHSGASVKRVQLALGHSTPTITLNTYVGEWPDTDRQIA
jgi:integrase